MHHALNRLLESVSRDWRSPRSGVDALHQRLRFVAGLLHDAAPLPDAPVVLWRSADGKAHWMGASAGLTVGRAADNDLVPDDPTVSRHHCRIEVAGHPPTWHLVDLGSRNGTQLEGRKVKRVLLTDGDVVEMGRFRAAFLLRGHQAAASSDP